jgi:hypothetical protein
MISMSNNININARHLSNPGPRLLVENALAKDSYSRMRVVVSSLEAAEDLQTLFREIGADVEVDQLVGEYHIVAVFPAHNPGQDG